MSIQQSTVSLCMYCGKHHSTAHCGRPDGQCYRCGDPSHKVGNNGNGNSCNAVKLQSAEAKRNRLKRRQAKRDQAMIEFYWAYVAPAPYNGNHPPPPPPSASASGVQA